MMFGGLVFSTVPVANGVDDNAGDGNDSSQRSMILSQGFTALGVPDVGDELRDDEFDEDPEEQSID